MRGRSRRRPRHYMGDVIGDLNARRGKILGMDASAANTQVITCERAR